MLAVAGSDPASAALALGPAAVAYVALVSPPLTPQASAPKLIHPSPKQPKLPATPVPGEKTFRFLANSKEPLGSLQTRAHRWSANLAGFRVLGPMATRTAGTHAGCDAEQLLDAGWIHAGSLGEPNLRVGDTSERSDNDI